MKCVVFIVAWGLGIAMIGASLMDLGGSVFAGCSPQCWGTPLWTTQQNQNDNTGGIFAVTGIVNGQVQTTCKRYYMTSSKGSTFTDNMGFTSQYAPVDAAYLANLTVQCYQNGGIPGNVTGTNYVVAGATKDVTCFNNCTNTAP